MEKLGNFFLFLSFHSVYLHPFIMDKNIFIEKVTALFLSHGPRTLTMDDIAKEFSISKKTLYQMYSNKEEILKEVMIYSLQTIFKVIRENSKKYDDPLAFFLLSADETLEDIFVDKRDAFFHQMIKYYPEIFRGHIIKVYEEMNDVFTENIIKGREMGIFRKDFDHDMYTKFYIQLVSSVGDSLLFVEESNDKCAFRDKVVDFYLNAILTEKGKENLKELKENDKKD